MQHGENRHPLDLVGTACQTLRRALYSFGLSDYSVVMIRTASSAPGAWVCSPGVDRYFLRAGLYAALLVLVLFIPFGGPPRLNHDTSGPLGLLTLLVYSVLVVPHFTMTWWLWLGNGPLRAAMLEHRYRFGLWNAIFLLTVGGVLLYVTHQPGGAVLALTTIGVFDAYHFIAQDKGFLATYRHRSGDGHATAHRENWLMRYIMVWMLLNTLGHPEAAYWVDIAWSDMPEWPLVLPPWVFWVSHAVLGVLVAWVLIAELRRPEGPRRNKLWYLASALGSYILVPVTPLLGYFAARVHHSASYLGLGIHMVRNLDEAGHFTAPYLPDAARSPRRFLMFMTLTSLPVFAVFVLGAQTDGYALAIMFASLITFHHYFVDTFIWRFRRPEIRRTVSVYI